MPSIAEEVAAGVAQAMGPIAENFGNTLAKQIRAEVQDVLKGAAGKTIVIKIEIPDLTKPNV